MPFDNRQIPPQMPPQAEAPREPARSPDALTRFLGGSPGSVFVRFVILSVIVGMVLVFFGFTPESFFRSLRYAFEDIFGVGIDALHNLVRYFLYGAAIVLPIWVVSRLLSRR